jgi:predicted TIM-barrel fold metal-dependent hydrolase
MSDASERTIHDADAHLAQTSMWLCSYADPGIRRRLEPLEGRWLAVDTEPDDVEIDLREPVGATAGPTSTGADAARDADADIDLDTDTDGPATQSHDHAKPKSEKATKSTKSDKGAKRAKGKKHKKHPPAADHEPVAGPEPAPERRPTTSVTASPPTLALDPDGQARALDRLGFETQLLFDGRHHGALLALEHRPDGDLDLLYGAARAHNRALLDVCSADVRLLPTGYLPLADPATSVRFCTEVIDQGAAALLVPSRCPQHHGPSHVDLEPVWSQAEEAGIPVVFHLGGGELEPAGYGRNGRTESDGLASVAAMGDAGPPMQALATLILDGVLERYPELRFGVIDHGAAWLPSWVHQLESTMTAYCSREEQLRQLTLRPSEYVRRQVRVTPHPSEDVGWVIDQVGPDVCLFSSDHPVLDDQRPPLDQFEHALGGCDARVRDQFYAENFVDLMGAAMPVLV